MKPYVLTISSEKGGVGKTTLATNLAIYLRALNEELPVTLFSFDNHFSVDQMFRLGRGANRGTVRELFEGRRPEELLELGEFGVHFIPSSPDLQELRERIRSPELLAAALAQSSLEGVVIIDTRPDLDHFTQNALYAADRVIVPVKDAPSLENCRHLFQFFERHGLSRKPLRLLPCLVDSRIRFQGPFRDAYRLLKGYAINRGYRCLEGYIAKSPKVESLNTNPDGRIYPILTHGRGTEVHLQYAHVARQVYLGMLDSKERRLQQVGEEMAARLAGREEDFRERRSRLLPHCLLCDRLLVEGEKIDAAGYYAETFPDGPAGFIDEECFSDLVFSHFYRTRKESLPTDSLRDLFRESAQRTLFAFARAPGTRNFVQPQLAFYRFDEEGLEVSGKVVPLEPTVPRLLGREASRLFRLAEKALLDPQGRIGDRFLLVTRTASDFPEEILFEEHHRPFRRVAGRIAEQLDRREAESGRVAAQAR